MFYVGRWPDARYAEPDSSAVPRRDWRTITVGLHLPDWPVPSSLTSSTGGRVPLLPVPVLPERERRDARWLLTLDRHEVIRKQLSDALPVVSYWLMFVTGPG